MTIERRTDYLWGFMRGEGTELIPGSVIEREVVLDYDYRTTQKIHVMTPDIILYTVPYFGRVESATLIKNEINKSESSISPVVGWRNALIGKMDRIVWSEKKGAKGKQARNVLFQIQPKAI